MKVVVTGGAGFIGSHIVDALCARGADVIVIDSLDPGVYHAPPSYLHPRADYCIADLRTWKPDSRFEDVQALVHLAALGGVARAGRERAHVIGANCLGTARLVDALSRWSKLRTIVLCSSFSIYGANYVYRCRACGAERNGDRSEADLKEGRFEVMCTKCAGETELVPITELAAPNPLEAYGASKFMQELCFRGVGHPGLTILRFSSVYGSRLRYDDGEATIIAKLAGWIRSGHRPHLFEDGRQIRDWVHVDDIVAVALKLIDGARAEPIINICSGVPTTLVQACDAIATAMGSSCSPEVVGGYRTGDMRHCLGNPARVRALLERDPVPFAQGATSAFRLTEA
jgi:dTDP-L-rhamnose 4-epimerase